MSTDRAPAVGETHYDVLGVPRDADRQRIARAYRAAMRRLHPDVSVAAEATDGEVLAVQEAWRILGDSEARAAYDRESSGSVDAWTDVGWGVALDDPGPAEGDGTGRVPPRAEPRPGGDDREVFDPAPQDEPWRTPFAPGAVRVPEPVLRSGPPRRDAIDWLLTVLAVALASVAVVAGTRVHDSVLTSAAFPGFPVLGAAAMVAALPAAVIGIIVSARSYERGSEARAAGLGVAGVMSVCTVGISWGYGLGPTLLGLVTFAAGATMVMAVRRRRAAVRRVETDQVDRMTAYHRAVEWNRIREALRAPGSRVEQSRGAPGSDEPLRVRTEDPVTGQTTLRDLDVPLPRGAWVVVDDSGSTICTAPPGALEAWLATWSEAGDAR